MTNNDIISEIAIDIGSKHTEANRDLVTGVAFIAIHTYRKRVRDAAVDEDVRVAKIRAVANDERNSQERENAELRIALREARAEIDRLRAFQEAVIANAKNFT